LRAKQSNLQSGSQALSRHFLLFIVLTAIQGCALFYKLPPQPPLSPEDVTRALSQIREQDDKVRSFFTSGRLKVREGVWEQEALSLVAATRDPERIKIEITHPWGQPVVHLLVEGRALSVLSFAKRKIYVGEVKPESLAKIFPGLFDHEVIWSVLRGYPTLKPFHHAASQEGNQISLFLQNSHEIERVDIDPEQFQPVAVLYPDMGMKLEFEGFQENQGIIYARQIRVLHPKGHLTLTNEKAVFNSPIPDPIFVLERPPGFVTEDLEALKEEKSLF